MSFETWYRNIPIVTRTFLTLSVVTSVAITFEVLSPFHLYLNYELVWKNLEIWRILTTFLFFDRLGLTFLFHVYFIYFYCRRLEEDNFRGGSADFLFMILFGALCLLIAAPFLGLPFLSQSLVAMILYVWGRLNPHQQLRIYGLFTVGASYLALILLCISFALGGSALVDAAGIAVGHLYFYLAHVLPSVRDIHVLKTPRFLKLLFHDENLFEFVEQDDQFPQQQQQPRQQQEQLAPQLR